MEAALDASATEFTRHVKAVWHALHAAAREYMGSPGDASDLVQEALMRAWRAYSTSDAPKCSKAWLFVILRNVAFEWRRQARRRVRLVPHLDEELTDAQDPHPDSGKLASLGALDEAAFLGLLDNRLMEALGQLDDPAREIIVLSVGAGLSYREMALVLQCPVGTVMSRMARARRRLREELARHARCQVSGREVCR